MRDERNAGDAGRPGAVGARPGNAFASERALAVACVLLVAAAALLPPVAQPADYHRFADTRAFLGIPNAADVLSNAAFLVCGIAGIVGLLAGRLAFASPGQRDALVVAYVGLVATALGSGWYHLAPDDATLVLDRYGMVIAFAGIGAAVAARIGDGAARGWLAVALAGGVGSVWWWSVSGNLTPYAVVQFGGLLVALALLFLARPAVRPEPRFLVVLGGYVIAKVFEHFDAELFAFSGGLVAGHPMKHLVAGIGTFWLVLPMRRPGTC